jgi:hypothetical protein
MTTYRSSGKSGGNPSTELAPEVTVVIAAAAQLLFIRLGPEL